jgi:bacterioferritin-associated ferredoxin
MLVCLCHSVTERELTQAVDLGLSTMDELRRDLSIGASCGSCTEFASRILANHLESKAAKEKPEDGAL